MLVDPDFLFRRARIRRAPRARSLYRVSDLELASRLSFFLWSSIPDDELLDAGRAAASCGSGGARAAGRRGCWPTRVAARWSATSPASGCTCATCGASRRIRGVPRVRREPARGASSRRPSCSSRASCARTAASLDLLTADYTFLNERLARHYGIPNVYGSQFRRVTLTDGRARGPARAGQHPDGDVVCDPDVAGAARQVGAREPPRRAAAAAAAERAEPGGRRHGRKALSVRERMEQHRTNPVCASCHAPMDPLGLRARELRRASASGGRRRRTRAIDASARLPDGSQRSRARPGCASCSLQQPRAVRRDRDGEAADLRARPRARVLRSRRRSAGSCATRRRATTAGRRSSLGIVQSTPFQMRRASDIMIVTKKASAAPHVPARHGCDARAAAARRHGPGVRRSATRRRQAVAPPGHRLRAERHHHGAAGRRGDGRRWSSRRSCEPLAPFRDQMLVLSGLRTRRATRCPARAPAITRARRGALPDRRASEEDRGRRHPCRHLDGSDRRAASSGRNTQLASLELALESREPVGACDPGYSCAYANTLSLAQPDDAAADGEQPAGGVRAAVRRQRQHRSARLARAARRRTAASSMRSTDEGEPSARTSSGAATARSSTSTSRRFATSSGGSRGRKQQAARELPALDQPAGIPRDLRRAREADVRPAGARLPGRPDARDHAS